MVEFTTLGWIYISTFGFRVYSFLVALANAISPIKLIPNKPAVSPKVSILIPARNEENNLKKTLLALTQQDYPNLEIIILDDHSTDNTLTLAQGFAQRFPFIKVIQGEPLPEYWKGKNWACHQLAQHGKGDYLFFIDADVICRGSAISAAMAQIVKFNLQGFSIFPDQTLRSFGERITVPNMHFILLSLLPLFLIRRLPFSSLAAANGQFLAIQTNFYNKYNFHEVGKSEVAEDIFIARKIKKYNGKFDVLLGNHMISCRMYTGFFSAIQGFSKNIIYMLSGSYIISLLLLFLMNFTWILGLIEALWILILADILLIYLTRLLTTIPSHLPKGILILGLPFYQLSMTWIYITAIFNKLTKRQLWKGRIV